MSLRFADADLAACKALLRRGSRSFALASLLLPRRVRDPAAALYAFCRVADDAVDVHHEPIERIHERVARAYEGAPFDSPIDRAFAHVTRAHDVPRALMEAHLEGFAWDAGGRRYDTIEDLHAYAARVAGAVGAMMTLIMGVRSREALARACDLGVAMQLTNIARDVGEDARAGRIYLPLDWLREAGVDPDALVARPRHTPALASVVARLLARAGVLYARAGRGIPLLPRDCQAAIRAARLIYADIGRALARRGHDAVTSRAVVSAHRKLWLAVRALATPLGGERADGGEPALPATQFLIDAVPAR